MLDPKFPIQIIHDKKNPYYIKEVLFSDDKYILAKVDLEEKEYSYLNKRTEEMIVISKMDGDYENKYSIMSTYFDGYRAINTIETKSSNESNFENILNSESFSASQKRMLLKSIVKDLGYDLELYYCSGDSNLIKIIRTYEGFRYTSNTHNFKKYIEKTDLIISNFHGDVFNIYQTMHECANTYYMRNVLISIDSAMDENFNFEINIAPIPCEFYNDDTVCTLYSNLETINMSLNTKIEDFRNYMKSNHLFNKKLNKEQTNEIKEALNCIKRKIKTLIDPNEYY